MKLHVTFKETSHENWGIHKDINNWLARRPDMAEGVRSTNIRQADYLLSRDPFPFVISLFCFQRAKMF